MKSSFSLLIYSILHLFIRDVEVFILEKRTYRVVIHNLTTYFLITFFRNFLNSQRGLIYLGEGIYEDLKFYPLSIYR